MTTRLSVDIGGTFTDVALDAAGELITTKVLTTYADPALGVLQGVEQVLVRGGIEAASVGVVLHGTTLATNALIERSGARTALLTTAGHRDVLEMAFENRFEQYDVNIDRPAPLVPRHWRRAVDERIAADGEVLVPLDERQVLSVVEELVGQGVDSLAVGFLHSYANPSHEARAIELIGAEFPALSITASSDVCPEIREYERFSTTVANAYVKPLISRYLASLASQLRSRGLDCQLLMMTSGGGLTDLKTASAYPIRLVESGPAGGAILAAHLAQTHGLGSVLSFDMGGTTAKICLIDDGEPLHSRAFEVDRSYRFKKGSGLPLRIPVIEMVEIGAGGGSIARVDDLQRVMVGPDSAGSEPGPACYGRGGENATVTDADVVLGKLRPMGFAGGSFDLDAAQARQAVEAHVGQPLGLDAAGAAFAIAEIVEENMASAARAHASEWGRDLQSRSLVAFGGAAPLHAARLAAKLKIGRVLVPGGAGVGSALGFLLAPVRFEVVRSLYMRLDELRPEVLQDLFSDMREEARAVLRGAGVDGDVSERIQAYMRYVGQGYEVSVEVAEQPSETALRRGFERAYADLYGRIIPGMDVEILSWTLSLTADETQVLGGADREAEAAEDLGTIEMFDGVRAEQVPVRARSQLTMGSALAGPALIVERQTTTVVPSGANLEVLADGTLVISLM